MAPRPLSDHAPLDGHDVVDPVDRQLHRERSDDRAVHRDRRHGPARGIAEARAVAREVGEHDVAHDVARHRLAIRIGQVREPIRPVDQVRAEVHALVRRVDDVAGRVDHQDVLERLQLGHRAVVRVVLRVRRRPRAAVARVVDLDRVFPRVVGDHVVVLQVLGRGILRREGGSVDVLAGRVGQLRGEVGRVVAVDGSGCLGIELLRLQLGEALGERDGRLLAGLVHRPEPHGVLDRREQLGDLAGAALADLDELLGRDRAEGLGAVDVADHADHDARQHADRQQHDQQDRVDRQTGTLTRPRCTDPIGGDRSRNDFVGRGCPTSGNAGDVDS